MGLGDWEMRRCNGWVASLLEDWDGFVGEEDGEEVEVDGLDLAEEFEEDFNAFSGGCDILDRAFHALEGAVSDLDFIAYRERRGYGDEFLVVLGLLLDLLDERSDERCWDVRNFRAEADEAAHALAEGDGALHVLEVEFGEDVAGEEWFEPPDFSTACGFAVFDARAEDFDTFQFTQVFGGDVFALGLGANAEPFR